MKTRIIVAISALVCFCALSTFAQTPSSIWWGFTKHDSCDDQWKQKPADRDRSRLETCFGLGNNGEAFALLVLEKPGYRKLLNAIEQARLDKQAGATSSSDGTTSLVSKGVVPKVLGFAVEHGAIARTDKGTTITYRGNALGMGRLLAGEEVFAYCSVVDNRCPQSTRLLEGLSMLVSFDPSRTEGAPLSNATSATSPQTFTGSTRQIAAWGIRYDARVRRDALGKAYRDEWRKSAVPLGPKGDELLESLGTAFDAFEKSPEYIEWQTNLLDRLMSANVSSPEAAQAIVVEEWANLVKLARAKIDTLDDSTQKIIEGWGALLGLRDKLLETAVTRVTHAFEYTQNRPLNQPSQSNFRYILSGRLSKNESTQITLNAAASIYDSKLPSDFKGGRWRDAQAALQIDRALGKSGGPLGAILSGGYYWQYMKHDALLQIPSGSLAPGAAIALSDDASTLLKTKGHIHIGQVKMTFSVRDTGIKIPIALTFSNRTELIPSGKGSDVCGNFGITYDLDSLLSKIK